MLDDADITRLADMLAERLVDRLADAVVERLREGETPPSMPQWTTAKGAARDLHVSPDTVLRRARALGAVHEIGRLVLVDGKPEPRQLPPSGPTPRPMSAPFARIDRRL
jgi:hypothetical protein